MKPAGWEASAEAWAASQGELGDFSRHRVLDPALERLLGPVEGLLTLDAGAGEGRYSRVLESRGAHVISLEPCLRLAEIGAAKGGRWLRSGAEALPFRANTFDLVVCYLVLIDVPDFRAAIAEMARVLKPGARLAVANMNPFATTRPDPRIIWENRQVMIVDDYLSEQEQHVAWKGIDITNFHRPLTAYMQAYLAAGLQLVAFEEPPATGDDEAASRYNRAPWHHVMIWRKP